VNSDSDRLDPQPDQSPDALAAIREDEKEEIPGKKPIGEIFSRAYEIYRDNPIMIVPSLIPVAALILGMLIFVGYVGLMAVFEEEEGFIAFYSLAGLFLFLIIIIVLFFLAEGMTIEMIREAHLNNKADISSAWQATLAKMKPLAITSLLAGTIVAIGFVLFFVPGIILSFAFYFVIQAVMIDGKSGTEALRESYRFVEANLSDSLIIALVSLGIGAVLPSIPFIGFLISLLSLPYVYGLATLLYLDERVGRRDEGLEKMARC
jgi:hypothetical protein